ncbi:MAG: tocopherol cyclase family protein, partial [Ignavibacteria bacterium]
NCLTMNSIEISTNELDINLSLMNNHPIPTFKNSMGYHYYVPTLPCYHSVLNSSHLVSGSIRHNESVYALDEDMGYMEKNWGTSFPENYFWIHAVDPYNPQISLLFSIAEIQWLGKRFIKHVGHLRIEGKHIDLRALKDISIADRIVSEKKRCVKIKSKELELDIWITYGNKVTFKGPNQGHMSRDIFHHADAMIGISLKQNGKTRMHRLIGNFEHIGSSFI